MESKDIMPAVLITGASRGFGRALFETYSQRGWITFPLVREPTVASQFQDTLASDCYPIIADVSTEHVEHEIARVLERHTGSLNLLINNAGSIKKKRGLDNTTVDDLEELFRVHCAGAFRCTRAALPFLAKGKRPVVVNISSRWGSIQRTVSGKGGGIYSYQIAKCAQNMLSACLDQELGKVGIRVFAIHPGRLKTEVAAPDADVDPGDAANALANWVEQVDHHTMFGFYDLMSGSMLDW
jgi:NAD(P)-dependent dehydrogenase (short-subunit alcohol dehydrogenase family)